MLAYYGIWYYNRDMAWNDYKDLIDFNRLSILLMRKGLLKSELSSAIGASRTYVSAVTNGICIPNTEVVTKICSRLECSVDEVVQFKDIEVKDFYKGKDPFIPHKAEVDCLYTTSYEPLRQLLLSVYGEDAFQVKFNELLSKIKPVGASESQLRRVELMRKNKVIENKTGRHNTTFIKGGLTESKKACFKHDRPVNMRLIYNLCKVLGCTPAWVLTYK